MAFKDIALALVCSEVIHRSRASGHPVILLVDPSGVTIDAVWPQDVSMYGEVGFCEMAPVLRSSASHEFSTPVPGQEHTLLSLFYDESCMKVHPVCRTGDGRIPIEELVSMLGHDLAVPLRVLCSTTSELSASMEANSVDPLAMGSCLEGIQTTVVRMDHMIHGMMVASGFSGNDDVTKIDLALFSRQIIQSLSPARCVELRLPPSGTTCQAPPGRLAIVLQNLVQNALRVMTAGVLEISYVENPGASRIIVFNGPVMAEDSLEVVRTSPGLGLGIVWLAVNSWDGRIESSSIVGEGNQISFTLPRFENS